jgi:predicted nucleic acid-binding protein
VIVVDSSALVAALTGLDLTPALRGRLHGEALHAPSLLEYEVVSAARKLVRERRLDEVGAAWLFEDFDDLPIRRWPLGRRLRRRAFELRHTHTAYDASYVALAEALECPLITRDAHLARSHGHQAAIELH